MAVGNLAERWEIHPLDLCKRNRAFARTSAGGEIEIQSEEHSVFDEVEAAEVRA